MITNVAQDVRAFTSNAFLVDGDRRVLVDTGANFDVVARVGESVDGLEAVVLTHAHPDHVGNLGAVKDAFDVDAWGYDPSVDGVDREIEDGGRIRIGDHEYEVLHTPGHKDDHCCFYAPEPDVLFAGDLIFQNGSFGRTDLEEGDRETLIESIDRVEARVDENLRAMHAGHGPSVTEDPYEHVQLAARTARQA